MLIEKDGKFLISDYRNLEEIRNFLKANRNNPKIPRKAIDELYSLYIFLHYLCDSAFSLPLHITKPDPPDFVLEQKVTGHKTGIEVVSSGTQIEKHAFDIMNKKYPQGSRIEKPFYVLGSDIDLKKEDIEKGIRKPGEPLISDGFGNNGREKAWLNCIYNCLNAKIFKLNKENFSKYHSNQLIIYDDACNNPKIDHAISNLRQEYKSSAKVNFDSAHIIMFSSHLFIADVFGQCIRFNIPPDLV